MEFEFLPDNDFRAELIPEFDSDLAISRKTER